MKQRLLPTIAVTVLLAALAAGCGDDEPTTTEDARDSDTPSADTSPDPSSSDATATSTESSEAGSGSVTVPVYFVGDTPQGPRLFREFRKVEADNPLEEAAALLTAGDALDPDYRTLFPAGDFTSVTAEGDELVATVPDDAWRAAGDLSPAEARLAVQQLVYTLQGVQQARATVRVVGPDGTDEPALLGVDASDGFTNAPPIDVLALVNITAPEEGATVSGSFPAEGVASSFEATVPWEIRDASGEVVLDGFSTAEGWGDRLYPWSTDVDVSGLEPGDYSFVALTDDPSGGEGPGPTEDSKTIVVQ